MTHNMSGEANEKPEVLKGARIYIPGPVHERVVRYQARLIGRRGGKVTFADACVELLDRATRTLK